MTCKVLILFVLSLLFGCTPNEEHIDVTVSYNGEKGDAGAEVHLMAGIYKSYLGTLQVGDRRRARLVPGRAVVLADERRLFMRYYIEGHSKLDRPEWHGPDVPMDVSYRIAIDIHTDGRIESSYCIKPCELPE